MSAMRLALAALLAAGIVVIAGCTGTPGTPGSPGSSGTSEGSAATAATAPPVVATPPAPPPPPAPPAPVVVAPSESSLPQTVPADRRAPPKPAVKPTRPGDSVQWLAWETVKRYYVLRTPPAYDGTRPLPLVIVLHARGSSAQGAKTLGFSAAGDREGFFVAYPEALGQPRIWHAAHDRGPVTRPDDRGYLEALIGTLRGSLNIDPRRIYVVGYSSGGMMAYELAAQLSHTLAAVGVVAASVGARDRTGAVVRIPPPQQPVAVMHIHGRGDRTVPYAGGRSATLAGADYLSARDSIAFWVEANRCKGAPTPTRFVNVTREAYSDCAAGTAVELVTLEQAGHDFPRLLRLDPQRPQGAVETLWAFFTAHSKAP
jgi:polyhydroxybutyrate depolymerase